MEKVSLLKHLNKEQTEAVISKNNRLLVLAGAGSGKTQTLLNKILHLIEAEKVSPSEILAITFTKNAANEMIDRLIISADTSGEYQNILNNKKLTIKEKHLQRLNFRRKFRWIQKLTIRTFHSFCYQLLRNYGVNEFDNRFKIIADKKIADEEELSKYVAPDTSFEIFQRVLIEQCEDRNYMLKLKRYVLDYIIEKLHIHQNHFAASYEGKFYKTLDGTLVRSKSEQFIADWLYRHSIRYEYEPDLNVSDFHFRPDFFIPDANIYLEHNSNKSYNPENKVKQFKKGQLLCVTTNESISQDSALFNHTLDKLVKNRLPGNYHPDAALSYREEFNHYHEDIVSFITQVMRITDMIKVENHSPDKILKKALADKHERIRLFYELAVPLVKKYVEYCTNKSFLDFNDLINTSIKLLNHQKDITHKIRDHFRFILVDEFQDVNKLQVELLKKILKKESQLFCVGDDWQSIYGFRGSDVGYIIHFEKHFPQSKIIKLNLNYRSTQNIVSASNEVIKHNKFSIAKKLLASKKSEHKITVYAGNNLDENIEFCLKRVDELTIKQVQYEQILFLYRRNKMFDPYRMAFKQAGFRVSGKTIHASKGLEADYVFIIGLTEGYGGFPDVWMEDRIFQTIKKANHDLLMEEERRLFYVALTRAREKLFLITEKGNESPFISEIPEIFTVKTSESVFSDQKEVFTCSNCFSELEKLFVFCPYCGSKISNE